MISLSKNQKVDLRKPSGVFLSKVTVGLGWDPINLPRPKPSWKNLFGLLSPAANIDCDASVICCRNGKYQHNTSDLVYFANLEHSTGAVKHMGDNLTGEGEGDDEQILLDLNLLPGVFDRLIFVVNIFSAKSRGQHFGMVQNCFIRICDETGAEFCRYNLSENYDGCCSMIFGELLRTPNGWEFKACGQGLPECNIHKICEMFA